MSSSDAPAATMSGPTQKLEEMVNSTSVKLNTIWDEVGFSTAERDVQIQVLLQEVHRLFEEKVTDEEAVRDTFVQSIEENKAKAVDFALKLGEAQPNLATDEDGTTVASFALTEQLVHYEHLSSALEQKVSTQAAKLNVFRETLACLCAELDEDLEAEWATAGGTGGGSAADLSDTSLAKFEAKVTATQEAKTSRVATITELVASCQELLQELAVAQGEPQHRAPELDAQILGSLDATNNTLVATMRSSTCVGIGASSLANLQARQQQLAALREERAQHLMTMGEKVARLWELLAIDESEQAAFEDSLTGGLSEATIAVGEKELARLEALKGAKMAELVTAKRLEVARLWAATAATDAQQRSFEAYYVTDPERFDDAVLELHDAEVARLERRLETMQPLKQLFEKYESAANARAELEELQKDKDRLKGRNSSKQLKLEEGMGKQIKSLPKVIEKLKKDVAAWELAEGAAFTVLETPWFEHGAPSAAAAAAAGSDSSPSAPAASAAAADSAATTGSSRPCLEAVDAREEAWASRKAGEVAAKKAAKDLDSNSNMLHPAGGSAKGHVRSSLSSKSSMGGGASKASKKNSMNPLQEATNTAS